jgi:hypothetical protein
MVSKPKRVSIYYSVKITKSEEIGSAWLMHIVKKDRDDNLLQEWYTAWKSLPPAKKHASLIASKRPKWAINEAKTVVLGSAEVRVLSE